MLPKTKSGAFKSGRRRRVDLRNIVNGIFYLNRTGCQWRMLPPTFGPWSTVHDCFSRMTLIWADGGYADQFVRDTKHRFGRVIKIVKRSDHKKFVILPKRWIVERTFGGFSKCRRLSKDYETLPVSSEAMIHITMINLMLHRLAPE